MMVLKIVGFMDGTGLVWFDSRFLFLQVNGLGHGVMV